MATKYYKLSKKSSLYVDPSNPTFVIRNKEVVEVKTGLSKEAEDALTRGHIREASKKEFDTYQSSLTDEEKKLRNAAAEAVNEPDEDDEDEDSSEEEEEEDDDDEDNPANWSKTALIDAIRAEDSKVPAEEAKGLSNKSKDELVALYNKYNS